MPTSSAAPQKKPEIVLAAHVKEPISRIRECKGCLQLITGPLHLREAQHKAMWRGSLTNARHHRGTIDPRDAGLFIVGIDSSDVAKGMRIAFRGTVAEVKMMAENFLADLAEMERRQEPPVEPVSDKLLDKIAPRNQPQPINLAYDPDVD